MSEKKDFESAVITQMHMETATGAIGLLRQSIMAAHSQACESNPLLSILLYEIIVDAAKIQNRIAEINSNIQPK